MLFSGFRGYFVVWIGQFVSLIGSAMTRFALTVWAYEQTESAMVLALVGFFNFGPLIIITPFAGALVDRLSRKTVIIASDLGAGLSTMLLLALFTSGNLEIWHLYVAGALGGISEAFQFPAFSAAVTMMVEKKHYARASGMLSLAQSASTVASPFLAGLLLAASGIDMVMVIDVITFLFAVSAILVVYIPEPEMSDEGRQAQGSLAKETWFGFKYILDRPSLLGMQMMFFLANLFFTMATILLAPMILARTGNDELALGSVMTVMGIGGVAGGLLMSIWGGPARRVHGVFIGMALSGLLGRAVIGLGGGMVIWAIGAFFTMFFVPILNGSNQAIWQSKVAPDLQGRVFAVRRLIAQITVPVAMLLSGFLADRVFGPAMLPGGSLEPVFSDLVGSGPGAGIALIFIATGLIGTAAALLGYVFPFIRDIEEILPDHEAVARPDEIMAVEPATD